jgi:serine/threonine protein kinase/tetratricopeptide (TPR) repeat protein
MLPRAYPLVMNDRGVLEHFPLPVARAYRRYLNALEARERHDAAYYLFEVYLKYAASIAIAFYLAGEARDHRVNAVLKGLARPSLGEWLRFLRECLKFLAQDGHGDPLIGALAGLFSGKEARRGEIIALHNALRSFRTGAPSQKSEVTLEALLSELVAYRNRVLGHGAPLDGEHYRGLSERLGAAFGEILDASPFLTASRLAYIDSVRVEEGARVECILVEFMGDQPVRRQTPHMISYGKTVPRARSLYLILPDGGLLLLEPLMLAHREDIYFLNEAHAPLREAGVGVKASAPEYLSYATGERHSPPDLAGAQGELFERILGYEVKEQLISRFGDDLVAGAPAPEEVTAEGERRLGDFRILRELGRGAMGTVFEAVQESLGRRVALKVLPGSFALDPKRLERFRREARATARIHHPSIVPVYEVGEAGGSHYYAMEFLDGPSLDKVLEEARKRPPAGTRRKGSTTSDPAHIATAVEQIAALAEGLHEAHRLGLVHRDVKPSNIIVDSSGRHVLVDFGLVREEEAQTLTRSGELLGTLSYMSPEQLSRRKVDARSDVYSLGATLYEVLTLKPPFGGESDHQVQNGILFEEPVPPRKVNPRVNRDLETVVLHALEKNPERRYPSAADLAADLRRLLRYEPVRARPTSVLGRLARRARRHVAALTAAAVILVLLVSLGWLFLKSRRDEEARLLAEYEPRVTRAVMKAQLGRLGQLSGENSLPASAERLLGVGGLQAESRGAGAEALEEALRELDSAVRVARARPDAHFHRAKALLLLDRVPEAREALDRALGCEPGFVPARILRAALLRQGGDAEAARRELSVAEASAGSAWAKAWLAAHQAVAEGNWRKAAEAYTALIDSGPGREPYLGSTIETRLGRGLVRLEAMEFRRAIEDFVAAVTLWPDAPEPSLLLGKAYYLNGEDAAADEVFQELHEKSPFPDQAALAVAAVYDSANDSARALEWVEARVKADFERERARSRYLRNLGRLEEAERAARAAIALNPGDLASRLALGSALGWQEKHREQVDAFRQALDANPNDPTLCTQFAWALMGNREFAEAEKVCRVGLGRHPADVRLMSALGRALSEQGKSEEAVEHFRKAIRTDPTVPRPYLSWAGLLTSGGRHKEAIEKLKEYLRVNPNPVPLVFLELALNATSLGDHTEAFIAWSRLVDRAEGLDLHFHRDLVTSLRLAEITTEVIERMDALIARLERIPEPRRDAWIHNTLAVLFLYHPGKKNAAKALGHATSAVERTGVRRPDFLATLAEARFHSGERGEAVMLLEEAAGLPGAAQFVTDRLREYLSQVPGGPPEMPRNLEPPDASTGLAPPVRLAATPFAHPDRGVHHLRSRWRLRAAGGGDRAPPAIDHVSKLDLESWAVPEGLLLPHTTYLWQVSHTGSNLGSSTPGAETSFTTSEFPWEAIPFDLSGQFNRDVVADPGDDANDLVDSVGCLLVAAGFDGVRADNPGVQGLPLDRRVGVHLLGDYAGKNSVQLSALDRGQIRIPVPPGSYSAVRFLVTGGNGDSLVPVVFEYSDGTTDETSLPCDDWFDDVPEEGKVDVIGVVQPGVVPALDGMDRICTGLFQDAGDPAIFEVVRVTRPGKRLEAVVLDSGRALYMHPPGVPTRFNLLAVTGIRAIEK